MNLQHQIKLHRTSMGLSQDELAEKIFVSRQTISNWETGKSYPDVHSLILMGNFFNISLDQLIKGDLEIMKNTLDNMDVTKFKQLSNVFSILMVTMIVAPIPLVHYLRWVGLAIFVIIVTVTMILAWQVEKLKKEYDIQTYREIVAFMEGTKLDTLSEEREKRKRIPQKFFAVAIAGIIAAVVATIFVLLFYVVK